MSRLKTLAARYLSRLSRDPMMALSRSCSPPGARWFDALARRTCRPLKAAKGEQFSEALHPAFGFVVMGVLFIGTHLKSPRVTGDLWGADAFAF